MGQDRAAIRLKPERHMVALRTGRDVARPAPAQIGLVDKRHADLEPLGHLAGRLSRIVSLDVV